MTDDRKTPVDSLAADPDDNLTSTAEPSPGADGAGREDDETIAVDSSGSSSRSRRSRAPASDRADVARRSGPGGSGARRGRDPAERSGSTAHRRYRLGDSLGAGGMGAVYSAADADLQRTVAVKCLNADLHAFEDYRERFLAEAKIMAAIDHPGAAPVYDTGTLPDGRLFYAMKRLRGRTLKSILDERGPDAILSPEVMMHLVDILERVCQTMAASHADRIIHRDLKPDNVMVDDFGAVFVIDWGLAKRLDEDVSEEESGRTQVGAVMGTPAYMSPELARGQASISDCQSDVFSLGIMLYEVLAGTNPFRKKSSRDSMKNVLHHVPSSPAQINKMVPRPLAAICMKALAKDPAIRYADAGELAADLRAFRELRQTTAYRPNVRDRVVNWARRHPALASGAATLLFAILVAAAAASVQATVESRLTSAAYQRMDEMSEDIRALDERLVDARNERGVGATAGDGLARRIEALEAERDVKQELLHGIAWAMTGFTLFSSDTRARDLLREELLTDIEESVVGGRPARARALLQALVEGHGRRNVFGFSEAEAVRMRERIRALEIQERLGTAPDS